MKNFFCFKIVKKFRINFLWLLTKTVEPWQFTLARHLASEREKSQKVTAMLLLLSVTQSPQKEFEFSVLNSINEWTDSNKADENQDHLSYPVQHGKKHSLVTSQHNSSVLEVSHMNSKQGNKTLRNFLTDVTNFIIREKITSV